MAKSILAGINGLCCSTTEIPTYAISEKYNPHQEGINNIFTVTTTGILDGTILNWKVINITSSNSDFILVSGTVTIIGGVGSFSVNAIEDLLTEGIETYKVQLIASGTNVAETDIIQIGDYSTSTPIYTITPNVTIVNEGQTVTFNVTASNTPNNTWLQWQLIPVSGASNPDFNSSSGGVEIIGGVGSFSVLVINDLLTEGNETFKVDLKYLGAVKATSSVVTINDTSLSPEGFAIIPDKTVVNEGGVVTFKVYTSSIANGTILTWTLHPLTGADLSPTSGSITINSNYAQFDITTIADFLTEGNETFFIKLFQGAVLKATSATVTINDTSIDTCLSIGSGFDDIVAHTLKLSSNDYLSVGNFENYNGGTKDNSALVNSDGTIDTSWINAYRAYGVNTWIEKRIDGKYIIAQNGDYPINGIAYGQIYQVGINGVIDNTFPNLVGKFNGGENRVFTLDNSDNIYTVGTFTSYNGTSANRIVGITSAGVKNLAFNYGSGFDDDASYIKYNSLNELVIVGKFSVYNGTTSRGLLVLNLDASIKHSFGSNFGTENFAYTYDSVNLKHYVGGLFTSYNGDTTKHKLMRFNNDWSVDNTFNYAGNDSVVKIAIKADGSLLISDFGSGNIKHVNTNGTINTSVYSFGVGFNGIITDFFINPDGSFMAFGAFTTYKTLLANRIAQISPTGNLNNC